MDFVNMSRGLRWLARAAAVGAALLWLAFFVDHLVWFVGTAERPPLRIWAGQAAHGVLIAGLLAGLRWPLAGNVVAILAAAVFFMIVDGPFVPVLFWVTVAPSVLFLAAWAAGPHATVRPAR
jgi:hypothetical protein